MASTMGAARRIRGLRLQPMLLSLVVKGLNMNFDWSLAMFRMILSGATLALAVPALSLSAAAQQAHPQDPAAGMGVAQQAPVQPAQSQPVQAQPANQASQVATIVESEYPVYDADKSGELDKTEFSKWLLALKQQEMQATGKSLPEAELTAWVSAAFQTADADKSGTVSKGELTTYLGG